eukprot:TRINITY_DN21202_c0_g1_i1.p1 TRINITY_DN21202_c0_g1~~TRINITY_DN21202_c0_g1_i1.p1  ORF type:complete len:623 (+),score=177.79 TRINITY_DN21202_c0_g1_i1:26-1870(+)
MADMWSVQKDLQRLPLPPLQKTLDRYIEALKPLVPPEDVEEAKKLAKEFAMNEGKILQSHLEKRKAACDKSRTNGADYPDTTWLERFWEEGAYLKGRDTIAIWLNVMLDAFDDQGTEYKLERTAWFIRGVLDFKYMIDQGTLPLEKAFGQPMCNYQYSKLFGTTRVPRRGCDELTSSNSDYICVERKGHWYKVTVVGVPARNIEAALRSIEKDAEGRAVPAGGVGGVSAMTALDRDSWADGREYIMAHGGKEFVETMEGALFHVSLTPHRPETHTAVWECGSHSHGNGIWFDKIFTILVHENGKMGLNVEHTPADARVSTRMITHACEYTTAAAGVKVGCKRIRKVKGDPIDLNRDVGGRPCYWSLMRLEVDEKCVGMFRRAHGLLVEMAKDTLLRVCVYGGFGAKHIKQVKCGPDSMVQLLLQLAFKRDQGFTPSTYETASLRKFLHGRTETLRVTSMESVKFVDAMNDPKATACKRAALFRKAADLHKARMLECMNAEGIDRHLMSLRMTADDLNLPQPAIFRHKTYKYLCDITLSTSQLAGGGVEGFGFSAPTPTCYGCSYRIFDDLIVFNLASHRSCKTKDVARFEQAIYTAAADIMRNLREAELTKARM